MSTPSIYFLAAEASGDQLAREVVDVLKATVSPQQLKLIGAGGQQMAEIGLTRPLDLSALSILGLVEGLKAYPKVIKAADEVVADILSLAPSAVVLVDSWGFMLRVAQRIRKQAPDIRLIKLVGPQVWATRSGRAKTLSKTVDHLLCIHQMEVPYYEPFGLKTTVIGNPALSRAMPNDAPAFREEYNLPPGAPTILVLPGSRDSEITKVAPDLVAAAARLKRADTSRQIIFAPADNVRAAFTERCPDAHDLGMITSNASDRYSAMAASDLALACSGTVTMELAKMGVPMIVAYRMGAITFRIAQHFLYKPNHASLLNIANDAEIIPEFLQKDLTAENVSEVAEQWLRDPLLLKEQKRSQTEGLTKMKQGDRATAQVAAEAILSDLGLSVI